MEPTNELITKAEANAEGFSVVPNNECMTKAEFVANLPTPPHFSYDFPLGNKRSIVIINGSIASKTIQIMMIQQYLILKMYGQNLIMTLLQQM